MGLDIHTIEVPDAASPPNRSDRLFMGLVPVAYGVGAAAGDSVVVTVPLASLPPDVVFFFEARADVEAFVSTDYNGAQVVVTIVPRLASETIAAGTINALLFG